MSKEDYLEQIKAMKENYVYDENLHEDKHLNGMFNFVRKQNLKFVLLFVEDCKEKGNTNVADLLYDLAKALCYEKINNDIAFDILKILPADFVNYLRTVYEKILKGTNLKFSHISHELNKLYLKDFENVYDVDDLNSILTAKYIKGKRLFSRTEISDMITEYKYFRGLKVEECDYLAKLEELIRDARLISRLRNAQYKHAEKYLKDALDLVNEILDKYGYGN